MKDADKNRDPERARKRAKADARCALRKLGILGGLEDLAAELPRPPDDLAHNVNAAIAYDADRTAWEGEAADVLRDLLAVLDLD